MPNTYPYITARNTQQLGESPPTAFKVLIVAQDNSTTYPEKQIFTNVQPSDVGVTFTADEILGDMIREFKAVNAVTQLDVMVIKDNSSGTAASASLTFAGTATVAGTITFHITKYMGGNSTDNREGCTFDVPVTIGMTDEQLAAALTAQFNDVIKIPVKPLVNIVAQADTKKIEFQAINKGTVGNSYLLAYNMNTVTGITITKVDFANGATDPVITEQDLADSLANLRYQMIVPQVGLDPTPFKKLLADREQVDSDDYSGIGMYAASGNKTELLTAAGGIATHLMSLIGTNKISNPVWGGNEVGLPEHAKQSQAASIIAKRNTEGANISSIMTSQAIDAMTGGVVVCALPYQNTILPNMHMPFLQFGFKSSDIRALNDGGVLALDWDNVGNRVILSEGVTCVDISRGERFHILNNILGAMIIREYLELNYKKTYAQCILARRNATGRDTIITKEDIMSYSIQLYNDLILMNIIDSDPDLKDSFSQSLKDNIKIDYDKGIAYINWEVTLLDQLDAISINIKIK